MTNQPNTTPIKDILGTLGATSYCLGQDYVKGDGSPFKIDELVDEAEQAIQAYIDQRILEARIDEVNRFEREVGTESDYYMNRFKELREIIDKSNQSKGTPHD